MNFLKLCRLFYRELTKHLIFASHKIGNLIFANYWLELKVVNKREENNFINRDKKIITALVFSNTWDFANACSTSVSNLELIAKKNQEFQKFLSESSGYGCEFTKTYNPPSISEKIKYEQVLMHFLAACLYWRSLEHGSQLTSKNEFKILLDMDVEESNNFRSFAGANMNNTFFSQQSFVRRELVKQCPAGFLAMPHDVFQLLSWMLEVNFGEKNFLKPCIIKKIKFTAEEFSSSIIFPRAPFVPRLLSLTIVDMSQIDWVLLIEAFPWLKDFDELMSTNLDVQFC